MFAKLRPYRTLPREDVHSLSKHRCGGRRCGRPASFVALGPHTATMLANGAEASFTELFTVLEGPLSTGSFDKPCRHGDLRPESHSLVEFLSGKNFIAWRARRGGLKGSSVKKAVQVWGVHFALALVITIVVELEEAECCAPQDLTFTAAQLGVVDAGLH